MASSGTAKGISCNIIWYDETDSTNTEAARRLDELDNMSVIAARCQTAGRGKGSRKWAAAPGENLTFTAVLKYSGRAGDSVTARERVWPPFPASCQMLLSAAAAASVVEFLSGLGISSWVKWPNDVYVGGGKICGILIEHRTSGTLLKASIIGIGININQTVFPPELVNPVSVAALTGRKYAVEPLLERFCGIFREKMLSVYRELPHLGDVIAGVLASEDGAAGDENVRACFSECVNVLL